MVLLGLVRERRGNSLLLLVRNMSIIGKSIIKIILAVAFLLVVFWVRGKAIDMQLNPVRAKKGKIIEVIATVIIALFVISLILMRFIVN